MGNHVSSGSNRTAAIGIDNYVAELRDCRYEKSLGNGRFLRTILCKVIDPSNSNNNNYNPNNYINFNNNNNNNRIDNNSYFLNDGTVLKFIPNSISVVVKVFVKSDSHIDLIGYKRKMKQETALLANIPNVLPISRILETDRAGYMIRQYLYINLYDRISTRPFLSMYEKKWVVYQLLVAVAAAHSARVTHGDIKTENVLVTTWNWVYLTDFCSFKPTYLPEDNPADFNFYFDTSGRRSCYIAPERFTSTQNNTLNNLPSSIGISESSSAVPTHSLDRNTYTPFNDKDTDDVISESSQSVSNLLNSRYNTISTPTKVQNNMPSLEKTQSNISTVDTNIQFRRTNYNQSRHRRNQSSMSDNSMADLYSVTPAMDIFSLGCTIAEIFLEGTPLFTFPQLIQYRKDEYNPCKELDNIEDENIRNAIKRMISLNPQVRGDAEQYLSELRGVSLPEEFYSLLHPYLASLDDRALVPHINSLSGSTSDIRIEKITKSLPEIVPKLRTINSSRSISKNLTVPSFLILSSIICASIRNTVYPSSKLNALNTLVALSKEIDDEFKVDRLIPYCVQLLDDSNPMVRTIAFESLTDIICSINKLPSSEAKIFVDYVIPGMCNLAKDKELFIKATYARNMPIIAEKAIKLVNDALKRHEPKDKLIQNPDMERENTELFNVYMHTEQQFEEHITSLLGGQDVLIKRSLLKSIIYLCKIFNYRKINDILLSHIITYLNEGDWQLRCDFFEGIKQVGDILGPLCLQDYILPLLIPLLTDADEPVIACILETLTSLMDKKLINDANIKDLLLLIIPLVCHPTIWIRYGAVGFIEASANNLSELDILCVLYPSLQPFLKYEICKITAQDILDNLLPPITRELFDQIITFAQRPDLTKNEFQYLLSKVKPNMEFDRNEKDAPVIEQQVLSDFLSKIHAVNISESDRHKIYSLRDFILHFVFSKIKKSGPRHDTEWTDSKGKGKPTEIALQTFGITPHTTFLAPLNPEELTSSDIRYLTGDEEIFNSKHYNSSSNHNRNNQESYINQIALSSRSNRDSVASFDLSPNALQALENVSEQIGDHSLPQNIPDPTQNLFNTSNKSGSNLFVISPSSSVSRSDIYRSNMKRSGSMAEGFHTKDGDPGMQVTRTRHKHNASMGSPSQFGAENTLASKSFARGGSSNKLGTSATSGIFVSHRVSAHNVNSNFGNTLDETSSSSPSVLSHGNINLLPQTSKLSLSLNDWKSGNNQDKPPLSTSYNMYKNGYLTPSKLNSNLKDKENNSRINEIIKEYHDPSIARLILKKTLEHFPLPIEELGPKVEAPTEASIMLGRVKEQQAYSSSSNYAHSSTAWIPEGLSIAHLAEHTGKINQLELSKDQKFFASCSKDQTIKIWDTQRIEKNAVNHSRLTYSGHFCEVSSLSFCESTHSIASAGIDGSIHINRIAYIPSKEGKMSKYEGISTVRSMKIEDDYAIHIRHFETEWQSILMYATSKGEISGFDLRSMEKVWTFHVPGQYGHITAISVDPKRNYLVVGTYNGIMTIFDIRFGLQVKSFSHPTRSKITDIVHAPIDNFGDSPQILVSTANKFNEVSLWDVNESFIKQIWCTLPPENEIIDSESINFYFPKGFEAGKVPSNTDFMSSSTFLENSLGITENNRSLSSPWNSSVQSIDINRNLESFITGGTDKVVRYWDYKTDKCTTLDSGISKITDIVAQNITYVGDTKVSYIYSELGSNNDKVKGVTPSRSKSKTSSSMSGSRKSSINLSSIENNVSNTIISKSIPTKYYTLNDSSYMHKATISNVKTSHIPFTMLISASTDGIIKCWK